MNGFSRGGSGAAVEEKRLKVAVWLLSMALNGMLSFRVMEILPPMLASVVWAVAGVMTMVGISAFFSYRDPIADAAGSYPPPETLAHQ